MSIASLSFAATLPTYTSVGSNGTVFANDTLTASGDVLVNTNDSSTNTASVLTSDFTVNGLAYTAQGFGISGNSLSVIYGLTDAATDAQQAQAADQASALSGGYPGNVTDFTSHGNTGIGDTLTSNEYIVQTEGVNGQTPIDHGSAFATVDSPGGDGLSIASISTGTNNTIDVVFNLTPPETTTSAQSTTVQPPNTGAIAPPSNASTQIGILAGLPQAGRAVADALGLQATTQASAAKTSAISSGALLANILNPGFGQPASLYSLVANFSTPQPKNALDIVA